MATADHTTFTQARLGGVPRIKRQPAKFRVRETNARPVARKHALEKQRQLSNLIIAGLVLCTVTYWVGLIMGTAIRH